MRNDLLEWGAGVIILLLIATAGYAQLAEDSIAGVWLFEEGKGKVAKDTSGNDNHAEFGSGAPKWVVGKYGQGIQLNGEDEWLTIPTEKGKVAEELDFKESTSFSIHAWVFPDGDATGKCIIWRGLGCSTWSQYLLGTGAHENGQNQTNASFHIRSQNGGAKLEVLGDDLGSKKWTHIVGTYDGKELKIYQDGKLKGNEKAEGPPWASPENVYIGADPGCGKRCQWKGIIDEIVVFNVTLDAGQVKTLGAGFERALSVNRNGKLTVTWGIIKTERN